MEIIGPRSVLSHIWELRRILFSVKEFQELMSYQIGFGTKPRVSSPFPICAHTLWTATSSHKHFEIDPRNCSNSRWKCRPKSWRKHKWKSQSFVYHFWTGFWTAKYYTCAHVNPQISSPFPMRAHTFFEQQQQFTNTLKSITEVMQTEDECEVKKHNKISVNFLLSFLDWDDGQHKWHKYAHFTKSL